MAHVILFSFFNASVYIFFCRSSVYLSHTSRNACSMVVFELSDLSYCRSSMFTGISEIVQGVWCGNARSTTFGTSVDFHICIDSEAKWKWKRFSF